MSAFPGHEEPLERGPEDLAAPSHTARLFAHIEGLAGEEAALLQIPAHERTQDQHERLHHITRELDRMFERLRERAEHLARHHPDHPRHEAG